MSASASTRNGVVDGAPPAATGRVLVLCFDGTNELYGAQNTNVVKFFELLKKNDKSKQMVYYQPGIGTYLDPHMWSPLLLSLAKMADLAVAWYLDAHIMGGYKFLMQYYKAGDRVCLFGFSRGAYTARCLAGMLHKVGLLPPGMVEQVSFAYSMYKDTSTKGVQLSKGFKQAFSIDVPIHFMGVWDTVASVGVLWARHLPFTSSNNFVRTFRHAMSLDEHRARFQLNKWHNDDPSKANSSMDPERASPAPGGAPAAKAPIGGFQNVHTSGYRRLEDQPQTDVMEVWFSGCHTDVGGSAVVDSVTHALSNNPLRWMINECNRTNSGVLFDEAAVQQSGLFPDSSTTAASNAEQDALSDIHDMLKTKPLWWPLEFVPFEREWQDSEGKWKRNFWPNVFRPRYIRPPPSPLLMHISVKQRMDAGNYKPRPKYTGEPIWTE
ncbi:hypothetical protein BOTBODRAFT_26928 [Botryobasidium botryosum FD-172 SS1]|uniref:T6SS Phospholipase effector Tle1-like catalytic domain-containing protein n=1 Tax=Botryobasidium botryosum (strain FD-172 SS1) TaxID=930990 RepID=A0A067N9Y0_BOTB1|nr:hypothetical protein BOTBODRAFT_26928 [Botryobasidium botryosum FD-172 SS1]